VNRFFHPIHLVSCKKLLYLFYDCGLVAVVHGYVRFFPQSYTAEPFKLFSLDINEALCVCPAPMPNVKFRQRSLFFLHFFLDLVFYWQSMAVPSRNVVCTKTCHEFGFDNNIFKDFIQSGPEVDMTVCIRRAVMENEKWMIGSPFYEFAIQLHIFP